MTNRFFFDSKIYLNYIAPVINPIVNFLAPSVGSAAAVTGLSLIYDPGSNPTFIWIGIGVFVVIYLIRRWRKNG